MADIVAPNEHSGSSLFDARPTYSPASRTLLPGLRDSARRRASQRAAHAQTCEAFCFGDVFPVVFGTRRQGDGRRGSVLGFVMTDFVYRLLDGCLLHALAAPRSAGDLS